MKIAVFGDWHGNTNFALKALNQLDNVDAVIHLGDFGVWPSTIRRNNFVDIINNKLKKLDKELWFVDGNHEDFRILKSLKKDGRGLGQLSSNIFHIPRSYDWEWDGVKFLGIGGGISVDRNMRTLGNSYFTEEAITQEDVDKALSKKSVDVIFSHEAPILPVPPRYFSESINRDSHESIQKIGKITAMLEPKRLYHGHYHHPYTQRFLNTEVTGLDCDLGTLRNNLAVLDTQDLD